eukprot:Gregarina_sp_Pseudo_9__773@NODE_1496_length_1545_cov_120_369854_g1386_i0_p3_GENE_NODE_1496_length_1545_cov_120_369854_g1386_i0NODE_1496_length_1545_cov_120_369854_g1386_i0_p3_ORF_typecomplete_len101_score15_92_NODE_1496_length_1545_cov_120_369854_g1386_i0512814
MEVVSITNAVSVMKSDLIVLRGRRQVRLRRWRREDERPRRSTAFGVDSILERDMGLSPFPHNSQVSLFYSQAFPPQRRRFRERVNSPHQQKLFAPAAFKA